MKSLLVVLSLVSAALPQQNPSPLPGGGTRNLELQKRLEVTLAGSSALWGISIRHVERKEGAGVRELEPFQTASVFKMGVLLEVFHQAADGKLQLQERVSWHDPERSIGSGLLQYLAAGLQPTWHDLATLMITISDNAATDLLCERVGIPNVNRRLEALGIEGFRVQACTRELILRSYGMDLATQTFPIRDLRAAALSVPAAERRRREEAFMHECVNCSTPAAMTDLFAKLLAGKTADPSMTADMLAMLSHQQFNQRLPLYIPARMAHKTGSLTFPYWVANDAGIVYLPNGDHLIVTSLCRGVEWEQSDPARKQASAEADERMGVIGKMVYEFYTSH